MNQASLHHLISKKFETTNSDELFKVRLATNLSLIKDLYFSLYKEDMHVQSFENVLSTLSTLFQKRPKELQAQDLIRVANGDWYQSEKIVGMQLYVDHFNIDIKGLEKKITYLEGLGINFIHLMPITPRPQGENDGGYAVNHYYKIDQRYGSMHDLLALTKTLRKRGIYLMLDFVANHTSDEFIWAQNAKEGDTKYQDFYFTYEDRETPNAFETTLPEIFPTTAPGNFTYNEEMDRWVMTVFNTYQWDLNYSNPAVFIEMLCNLTELCNLGVDVVRFDALAFMWKKLGTTSQNLPETHNLISLFKLCLQVIAPGVIILAEAIVSPIEIVKYFGTGSLKGNECDMAYNASLMALLWNSIATKKTLLLYKGLESAPRKPKETTWINYIRCHDDIGLGFEDKHIYDIGWDPSEHRKFILNYYCQHLFWSPAMGEMFMYNPKTGDGRITGSTASLLGLEKALKMNDTTSIKTSIAKHLMLHAIILSFGGIPMIYGGDEIGTLNDYSYLKDPTKKDDSRWINRPILDWDAIKKIKQPQTIEATIFSSLQEMIRIRKNTPALCDSNNLQMYYTPNPHVFIFERLSNTDSGILVVCNFNDHSEKVNAISLGVYGYSNKTRDLISKRWIVLNEGLLELMPYEVLWITT